MEGSGDGLNHGMHQGRARREGKKERRGEENLITISVYKVPPLWTTVELGGNVPRVPHEDNHLSFGVAF